MHFRLLGVLAILVLTGPACLGEKIFEDPRFITQKKVVEQNKRTLIELMSSFGVLEEDLKAAIALAASAKTDEEKAAAAKVLADAKGKLAEAKSKLTDSETILQESGDKLDEIAAGAINSPAAGVLGFISSLPGIGTLIGGAGLAIYTGIIRASRGNYKGAVKELATRFEDLRRTPEGKELTEKAIALVKDKMGGTGAGKALNLVLAEMGVLNKSGTGK